MRLSKCKNDGWTSSMRYAFSLGRCMQWLLEPSGCLTVETLFRCPPSLIWGSFWSLYLFLYNFVTDLYNLWDRRPDNSFKYRKLLIIHRDSEDSFPSGYSSLTFNCHQDEILQDISCLALKKLKNFSNDCTYDDAARCRVQWGGIWVRGRLNCQLFIYHISKIVETL